MNLTNKHIVLILIIIIVFIFIYNYDVYVVPKNQPLCKPVFVTKRELSPEERAELNESQTVIFKEAFTNLLDNNFFEGFDMTNEIMPPKTLSTYSVPHITDAQKIKVIDSVIKVLSYIPTTYNEHQIKEMVEYFSMIYNSSNDLETFYNNIANSEKISNEPYNSKYSHLILFLIGKFHSDIEDCNHPDSEYCPTKSNFNIKPEDIPNIINHYNKLKKIDEQEGNEYSQESQNILDESNQNHQNNSSQMFDPNSKKSKKNRKPKRSKKYLDQILAEQISEQLNKPKAFDIENTKVSGIPNLSDGPSSFGMSDSVDRDSISTRINSTPSAPYSPNFAGFAQSMFSRGSNCSSGNCSSGNCLMSTNDYLNSPHDAYYYKATDYLNQELQPVESFNSMSSNYAGYTESF